MFSLLGPYLLYIKIGLAVMAVAGAFWFGHHTASNACKAGQTKAAIAANVLLEKSIKQYQDRIGELEGINRKVVEDKAVAIARMKTDRSKFQRELANATPKDAPPAQFTMDFIRLWNDSISRVNGSVPAVAPDTVSITLPDHRIADTTRDALAVNHDALMQICGEWKANLDAIRAWDVKTFPAP